MSQLPNIPRIQGQQGQQVPMPAAPPFNPFSGIEQARASMASNYEKSGHYLERIDRCKIGQSRKKETFAAIEKTVIHVFDNSAGQGHSVGESITHMLMQRHDMFLPNLKEFIANTLSVPEDQITESECFEIFSDDNPLAGLVIEAENRNITTQTGNLFTRIGYRRRVPYAELAKIMSPENQERFFPGGGLQKLIEAEARQTQG